MENTLTYQEGQVENKGIFISAEVDAIKLFIVEKATQDTCRY